MTQDQPSSPNKGRGPSKTTLWLILAALAAAGALYTHYADQILPTSPEPATPTVEMIGQGARLFAEHCASCHGKQAEGQDPAQPGGGITAQGAFLAPALNGTGHSWHHPPDALFSIVKNGSPAAESPMKALGGKLSNQEIHAVLAYVMSLWPEDLRERYDRHVR